MTGTLTVTTQDVWPPRNIVSATGLGNVVFTIQRVVGGVATSVRGADTIYIYPGTAHVVVDAELPFGVPVTYRLVESDVVTDTDGPTTYTLTGGNAAVTDAITGLAAEVQVGAIDDLTYDADATVYNVDGLNRVVASVLGQHTTVLELLTTTTAARNQLRDVLANCTSGVFQLRGPTPEYDVDAYYAVLSARERRFSQDGTDPRRITAVTCANTDGWPDVFEAAGYTYADLAAVYTGLTYTDLKADYATYLDLARADLG